MPEVFQIPRESLTSLKDKVVLITGSTSGIGLATVSLALSLGAKVIAGDINPSPAEKDQQHPPPHFLFVQTDVSNWASLRNLFETGYRHFGRIDHVFANAGVGQGSRNFLTEEFEDVDADADASASANANGKADGEGQSLLAAPDLRVLNVNLIGAMYTVRLGVHFLRRSIAASSRTEEEEGEGEGEGTDAGPSIVLTASSSPFQDFSVGDYTIAKHGVLGILRGVGKLLSVESGTKKRVRLNAVAPSWTATGIIPRDLLAAMGIPVQEAEVVARSAVKLFVDGERDGELVYSWDGKFCEINKAAGGLLDGVKEALPNPIVEQDVVSEMIRRMAQ
ncbi:hypothetical protein BJX61DRAFT_542964 [Aspergillus egyptiacus]|nr:hypothetical protein BJX61DRAFT_542964 [Aspergillus egyptiacus]